MTSIVLGYIDPGPTAFDRARETLRGPRAHVYDDMEALALLEGLVYFGIGLRRIGAGFIMATWEMRHTAFNKAWETVGVDAVGDGPRSIGPV